MKLKSTLALLLLAAGSANAQSGLTIAGRVDMGAKHVDTGLNSITRLDSGTYTASRLIFRGTEDLGGGLSALFYMENRFNADTGAVQSTAKFWNAGSYVGLSSTSWGTVTLGRQYVPLFWSFLFADEAGGHRLHGFSAVQSVQRSNFARIRAGASPIRSAGSLDSISGDIYAIGISSAYEDNQIVYKTPKVKGFTAMLSHAFAEGYAQGTGKVFSGNVEYRQGPLYASVAATTKRGRVPAASSGPTQKLSEQLISSMYEVTSDIKLWGNFHPWQLKSVANSEIKGRDWMLGASWWFGGGHQLWINHARKTIRNCTSCNSSGWGLGYHHALSKRTGLYVSHGRVSNGANAANALGGFAPDDFGRGVRATAVGIALTF